MSENYQIFSITPATGVMDVLGNAGYTFNFAIADLVDNCISAHAKNIKIFFDLKKSSPYLYILDDGEGMSLEELKQAAIIGFKDISSERNNDDLGRYSTGLKSATRSFCDEVTISSKKLNEKCNSIKLDYSYIRQTKRWEAFLLDSSFLDDKIIEQGTLICCKKLSFIDEDLSEENLYPRFDSLEKSLGHIFGKFLLSNQIKLTLQIHGSLENKIEGWNPFSLKESKSTKIVYSKVIPFKNNDIKVSIYILPTFNNLSKIDQEYMAGNGLIEQEGFYVYRNNRLIKEGGWLGLDKLTLDNKCQYARIEVNIPSSLDNEFKINFSKNSLEIPDELKSEFLNIAKKARKESYSNFDFQQHPELRRTIKKYEEKVWNTSRLNGSLVLSVNKNHPLIQDLSNKLSKYEIDALLNLLTKSLPISTIQEQNTITKEYTDEELFKLMDEMYNKLLNENMNLPQIKAKMVKTEPFNNHKILLAEFFSKKENQDNDSRNC